MRLRIDLSYDGARFAGWAKQPGRATVQGEIESALSKVFRLPGRDVRTVVAGRTDAGVHALGQVCHVDIPDDHSLLAKPETLGPQLLRRLRGALRASGPIQVNSVAIAPAGFDARFSPLSRRYEYRIADETSVKDPRRLSHTVWLDAELDLSAMEQLGHALLGLHDWASFCRAREGATTIRTLLEFSWRRDDHQVLIATVVADAFCHSMVRSLIGAAVAVGKGLLTVDEVVSLRDAATRTSAWKTMPPEGLSLIEVVYPPEPELALRAQTTRNPRASLSD